MRKILTRIQHFLSLYPVLVSNVKCPCCRSEFGVLVAGRHVASLAVRMQELGMSEDIIRSNLEESTKSPASIVSPHATASGSDLKISSLEPKQLSWNPMEASGRRGNGRGSNGQEIPPLSEEMRTLLDSVRYRVIELANTGGTSMKSLVERYAHLLSNDIFVERYLVSREKNVEVTARKVSSHGDSRANGSMWFATAYSSCEKDFGPEFFFSLSLSRSIYLRITLCGKKKSLTMSLFDSCWRILSGGRCTTLTGSWMRTGQTSMRVVS